jgi:hypothetical protein
MVPLAAMGGVVLERVAWFTEQSTPFNKQAATAIFAATRLIV